MPATRAWCGARSPMSARHGEIPTTVTLVAGSDTAPEYRRRPQRTGRDPRIERPHDDVGDRVQGDVDDHQIGRQREEHGERALESLQAARVTSQEGERPRILEEGLEHQQRFLDAYAKLLTKMEEWEDFQEILELWRGLLDDQNDINRRYRTPGDVK